MTLLPSGRVLEPLQGRDFRYLWLGQATSAIGNVVQGVALSWLVLELTGSAIALSGVLLAGAIPGSLMTLVGGVITDRADPRLVMFWSDVIRAASMGAVAFMAFTDSLSLPVLYLLLIVAGGVGGIFTPASSAILPRLVSQSQIQSANSLSQSTSQVAMIVGAPLAGILVALTSTGGAILVNALTFVVSALTALAIRRVERNDETQKEPMWATARGGVSYLRKSRWLVSLISVDSLLGLAAIGPIAIGLPIIATTEDFGGPTGLGVMLSVFGLTAAAGMLWAGASGTTHRRGIVFSVMHLPQGAALIVLPFLPLVGAIIALAVLGFLSGTAAVLYIAVIQSKVPADMMGRVMSLVALGSFGLVPLSQAMSGLVAQSYGTATLFVAAGGIMLASALMGLALRSLRALD